MSRNPYAPPGATVADPPKPPIPGWIVLDFAGIAAELVALCLLFSRPANGWFRANPKG